MRNESRREIVNHNLLNGDMGICGYINRKVNYLFFLPVPLILLCIIL